jgi:hypothetical protein
VLKIDMTGLTGEELERELARHCSRHGVIRGLRIYPANGTLARPFALVDMETPAQAECLAAAFGRRTMGSAVVIVLQQEKAGAPAVLPKTRAPAADDTLDLILKELGSHS